ncbi:hypothetical protein PGT21_025430 [Puccinia graminis f. sp. tritici]|uniref:Uncharacterized protein n=1 Tax=Puccinia graminis f. sp. tritici TaxID=56615 RepID=A0A5B0QZ31_PUCGR|nr:hypothetical protein PGT21_025430 [Puccinia graminis f. sp. tritici]KAA1118552.1 hypothetical protein PGTUg99_006602 [Puccinia graminis f. sp. tritici]
MEKLGYALDMLFQLSLFALLDTSTCSIAFNELASHASPGLHGDSIYKTGNQGRIGGPCVKEAKLNLHPSNIQQACTQASGKTFIITEEDRKAIEIGEGLEEDIKQGKVKKKPKKKKKNKGHTSRWQSDKTSPTGDSPKVHNSEYSKNDIEWEPNPKFQPKVSLMEGGVTQKLFESVTKSESERGLAMEEDFRSRIKASFRPRESKDTSEIFEGVIKPQWRHFIDSKSQASVFLEESVQSLQLSGKNGNKIKQRDRLFFDKLLEIFKTQLKLSNHQDHISISPMDSETYIFLQVFWDLNAELYFRIYRFICSALVKMKMSRFEFQRRVVTLTNQITQKTLVENWNIISRSLAQKDVKFTPAIMEPFGEMFQLDREFPKVLDAPQMHPMAPHFKAWMSDLESNRRFRDPMDIGPRPTIKLSSDVSEILEEAERLNGADPWNVYHWINCLGLGQVENLEDLNDLDISTSVDIILALLHSPNYKIIPWYESPDRACVIRMFTEEKYYQHLNYICNRLQKMSGGSGSKGNDWKQEAPVSEILKYQAQDKVMIYDHGLDVKLMQTIKMTRQYNQTYREDWELFFKSFPLKVKPHQKEFIKIWFQQNHI